MVHFLKKFSTCGYAMLLLMLYLALVALRLLHEHAFVVCFNWVTILECVTIGWIPAKQYY